MTSATAPGWRPGDDPARQVAQLLAALTLDEKAALTAGRDMWSTAPVDRLGLPSLRVTDGPNGARGPWLPGTGGATSACLPCGSALGATWDPELLEEVGVVLGEEARTKQCRVLLAPTVNIHRSPLAGRNFECYSEDPLLSGRLAAGFVRGVQSRGVATTVKHFVGNDAEFERMTMNSVIDERTLREIYLLPFELAVRDGGALGVMTGYNRLNGTYCASSQRLLADILRGEWGFDGFVVTDWFAAGDTAGSARAGLDLEMPGPGRIFGPALAEAVRAGRVDAPLVDDAVRRLLGVFAGLGALDDPADAAPSSLDRPAHRLVARRAATAGMVLLENDGTLPLQPGALRRVAVLGPNADRAVIMGGGSASLTPHYRTSPLEALRDALPGVDVVHHRGCDIDRATPVLAGPALDDGHHGEGFTLEFMAGDLFTGGGDQVLRRQAQEGGEIVFFGPPPPGVPEDEFSFRATTTLTAPESGDYTFSLVQAGRARVLVDGAVVLDGLGDPPPRGQAFFGMGSAEVTAAVRLTAGVPTPVVVEFTTAGATVFRGVRVGWRLPQPGDLLEQAVAGAAAADVAVLVVGTTPEWESEGRDRRGLDLPGRQAELIRAVAAANRRTVVVLNAGAPVDMSWADDVAAIVVTWFGGQEMAGALADVLVGAADPGGRLPTTIPRRLEHTPAFGNFPGENGEVRYGEALLVGYRWYEARDLPVRYPFGHGLSYGRLEIGAPVLSSATVEVGGRLTVDVPVANHGTRRATEVLQCYVEPTAARLARPPRELKAFAKVTLDPGQSAMARLVLEDRAFAYYDPGDPAWPALAAGAAPAPLPARVPGHRAEPGWYVDPGCYCVHLGRSSADTLHVLSVEVAVDPGDDVAGGRRL